MNLSKEKLLPILFFICFFTIGIFSFKDYGISLDEVASRKNGAVSAKYIAGLIAPNYVNNSETLKKLPELHEYIDKDYGVFVELPLVALEVGLNLKTDRDIYSMRHLATFVIFFFSVICFYHLISLHFGNWKIALFGCLLLILSPRIFADAFYNSKDLLFMSFCIISSYTCIRFLNKSTLKNLIWHSLATAATINIRILGVFILLVTLGFVIMEIIKANPTRRRSIYKFGLSYLLLTILLTILFWPYLWENPLNFYTAFKSMSNFRWPDHVLYFGEEILARNLPWHYIPVWIVISTPFMYTLAFIFGFYLIAKNMAGFLRNKKIIPYETDQERANLLFLGCFLLPLIAVIALKSVLYDGWRQMYFIYPFFLLVGLNSIHHLLFDRTIIQPRFLRITTYIGFFLTFCFTLFFMIRNHPYQNVYFSILTDNYAEKNFEKDYWALSGREGLEHILKIDNAKPLKIATSSAVPANGMEKMLQEKDKNRIEVVWQPENETADYFVTNHRFLKSELYTSYSVPNDGSFKEIFSKSVDGIKIMSVYKRNPAFESAFLIKN